MKKIEPVRLTGPVQVDPAPKVEVGIDMPAQAVTFRVTEGLKLPVSVTVPLGAVLETAAAIMAASAPVLAEAAAAGRYTPHPGG